MPFLEPLLENQNYAKNWSPLENSVRCVHVCARVTRAACRPFDVTTRMPCSGFCENPFDRSSPRRSLSLFLSLPFCVLKYTLHRPINTYLKHLSLDNLLLATRTKFNWWPVNSSSEFGRVCQTAPIYITIHVIVPLSILWPLNSRDLLAV